MIELEIMRLRLVSPVVPAVVEADKMVLQSAKAVFIEVIPVTVLPVVNDGSVLIEDDVGSIAVAVPPVICVLEDERDVVVIKLESAVVASAPDVEVVKPISVVEKTSVVDCARYEKPAVAVESMEDSPVTESV